MRPLLIRTTAAIGLLGVAFRPAPAAFIDANHELAARAGTAVIVLADPPNVPALLQSLTSNSFHEREAATQSLRSALRNNILNTAEIAMIQDVGLGRGAGPLKALEPKMRAERIFKEHVLSQPAVKFVNRAIHTRITGSTERGGTQYRFGSEVGQVRAGDNQGQDDFKEFMKLANAADNDLTAGDPDGARKHLDELKAFVTKLSDAHFRGLGFRLNRQAILKIIQQSIDKVPQAAMEIFRIAGPPQGARLDLPIPGAGLVNGGGTFTMNIPIVLTPGEIDVTMPSELALMTALPPPLYHFAGYSAYVIPNEELAVDGPIHISFEYGPGLQSGNPVIDPNRLEMVWIANGRVEFLRDDFVNDVGRFTIAASYTPPSPESGLNQFGFFAVVQSVPEPSTLVLAVAGLVSLPAYGWRRWRKRKFES